MSDALSFSPSSLLPLSKHFNLFNSRAPFLLSLLLGDCPSPENLHTIKKRKKKFSNRKNVPKFLPTLHLEHRSILPHAFLVSPTIFPRQNLPWSGRQLYLFLICIFSFGAEFKGQGTVVGQRVTKRRRRPSGEEGRPCMGGMEERNQPHGPDSVAGYPRMQTRNQTRTV